MTYYFYENIAIAETQNGSDLKSQFGDETCKVLIRFDSSYVNGMRDGVTTGTCPDGRVVDNVMANRKSGLKTFWGC